MGISPEGIGFIGMLINFSVAVLVSFFYARPPNEVTILVESIRLPWLRGVLFLKIPLYYSKEFIREKKIKIVVVSGGFDPIHSGHIEYFNSAKSFGDKLIVAVNSDAWLIEKKGKFFMPFKERANSF